MVPCPWLPSPPPLWREHDLSTRQKRSKISGFCLSYLYLELEGERMAIETATPLITSRNERLKIFLHALLFVAGFALVFIIG